MAKNLVIKQNMYDVKQLNKKVANNSKINIDQNKVVN